MKKSKRFVKGLTSLLVTVGTTPYIQGTGTELCTSTNTVSDPNLKTPVSLKNSQQENVQRQMFREELLRSLCLMNRNPEKINVTRAMCYEVLIPPVNIDFSCNICGRISLYKRDSVQGKLVQSLPYTHRFGLDNYKLKLDTRGLCRKCGKNKEKVVKVNVRCVNCGTQFSWNLANEQDIGQIKWLNFKPPITSLDFGPDEWVRQEQQPDKIKNIAQYIYDHTFCPRCREKIKLNETK